MFSESRVDECVAPAGCWLQVLVLVPAAAGGVAAARGLVLSTSTLTLAHACVCPFRVRFLCVCVCVVPVHRSVQSYSKALVRVSSQTQLIRPIELVGPMNCLN
eukprot:COSAG06_NODE_4755_length_3982_cov_26.027199_1_plen_103_part_00